MLAKPVPCNRSGQQLSVYTSMLALGLVLGAVKHGLRPMLRLVLLLLCIVVFGKSSQLPRCGCTGNFVLGLKRTILLTNAYAAMLVTRTGDLP